MVHREKNFFDNMFNNIMDVQCKTKEADLIYRSTIGEDSSSFKRIWEAQCQIMPHVGSMMSNLQVNLTKKKCLMGMHLI